MTSFDTNIAVYAANTAFPQHARAYSFIQKLGMQKDVVICELMLVELFLKLCNAKIFPTPLTPSQAHAHCQAFRSNQNWQLVHSAPVMPEVWQATTTPGFAFRRIIDLRLGLTLLHHGVTHFATSNQKDFQDIGFNKVWNPIEG